MPQISSTRTNKYFVFILRVSYTVRLIADAIAHSCSTNSCPPLPVILEFENA